MSEVTVQATAKGYYLGPREPGDKFKMPLNKDGSQPKGSWFNILPQEPVKEAPARDVKEKKPATTVLTDEDLV